MLRAAVARVPDEPVAGGGAAPSWMCASERRRWADLPLAARRGFAASRALLRELLWAATGIAGDAWTVSAQPGNAPLARPSRGDAAVHVSLSHRGAWVAAAVGAVPVGIDLECQRPARTDPGERAALMLSSAELPAWGALAPGEREASLLARWTIKEAWFKASPPEAAPWDFRRVVARACAPTRANVRAWTASPLHVALCCSDAQALAAAGCDGLAAITAVSSWHVHAN